jgi:hypothetical protein
VLLRYNRWTERLPEADLVRIQSTADPEERLRLIKTIRERRLIEQLPGRLRKEVLSLPVEKQAQRLKDLRREEREFRRSLRPPWLRPGYRPTQTADFPPEVKRYLEKNLKPRLSEQEKGQLARAEGQWPLLVQTVVRLAEKHPFLPPLPSPRKAIVRWVDLPEELKTEVPAWQLQQKAWRSVKPGRWPEFALTFVEAYKRVKGKAPPPLGASRPDEFPADIRQVITTQLDRVLRPDERAALRNLEGRWPEYPRRLIELARRHKVIIPRMSLPGPPKMWESARIP